MSGKSKEDRDSENELFINHIRYKRSLIEGLREGRKEHELRNKCWEALIYEALEYIIEWMT